MARYTGPKSKIARKFGEAIFGEDKSFAKRTIHQDSMESTVKEQNALNMQSSYKKNKKQNIPMVSWNVSSKICTRKHVVAKG